MAAQRRPAGPEPCHRGAWQHEAKIGDSVFNQFETDIAAVEEKEFHPAFERSASSGRKPQMHLQADQRAVARSEEHTSELQSPCNLVCRLLLEKKKLKTS